MPGRASRSAGKRGTDRSRTHGRRGVISIDGDGSTSVHATARPPSHAPAARARWSAAANQRVHGSAARAVCTMSRAGTAAPRRASPRDGRSSAASPIHWRPWAHRRLGRRRDAGARRASGRGWAARRVVGAPAPGTTSRCATSPRHASVVGPVDFDNGAIEHSKNSRRSRGECLVGAVSPTSRRMRAARRAARRRLQRAAHQVRRARDGGRGEPGEAG